MAARTRFVFCLTLAASLQALAVPATTWAQAPTTSASAAATDMPLPELPELEPIERPPATPDAVQLLEARLEELAATTVDGPLATLDDKLLGDVDDDLVAAISQRLGELRDSLDGDKARRLLEKARKVGRKALRDAKKEAKEGEDEGGDWLVFMMSLGDSESETWRQSIELYGMMRMLERAKSTAAVREMIACYSYFGELVRIDLQRSIERLGDEAVAALIEAKKHDAAKVRRWARLRLDGLGRAIPGEAVSTTDPRVLEDVLRAFGRVRDVDATRVALSFANSERSRLRKAAREAVTAIGEPASWHLKDTYKSLTGNNPPRSWDWKRTARELFALYDRARTAKVWKTWEKGKKAAADGKPSEAVEAFDEVLAYAPMFEHRQEMAAAYLEHGQQRFEAGELEAARASLSKAWRLLPADTDKKKIESRLATIEGKELIDRGTPDRFILERAVELDPENEQAKALLASLEQEAQQREHRSKRYVAVAGIGLAALVALVLLLFWRRPKASPKSGAPAGHSSDETPADETSANETPGGEPDQNGTKNTGAQQP